MQRKTRRSTWVRYATACGLGHSDLVDSRFGRSDVEIGFAVGSGNAEDAEQVGSDTFVRRVCDAEIDGCGRHAGAYIAHEELEDRRSDDDGEDDASDRDERLLVGRGMALDLDERGR